MKKRILAISVGILCLVGIFAIGAYANQEPPENVVYEYALLGDVYTVGDGFVSGTTPTGEPVSGDTKELQLDWSQGSYRFVYENRVVDLRVYEAAPADIITVDGELVDQAMAGMETVFPNVTVTSGIVRSDGAPQVGNYKVSAVFWHGGKRVQTVRNIQGAFSFTPQEEGLWVLSYEYTDVFGRVRSKDCPFVVNAERIIISDLQEQYNVGESIHTGDIYGYYMGKQYPVTAQVVTPQGETAPVSGELLLSQPGDYDLLLSAEIDGQTVTEKQQLSVKAGLASYVSVGTGFKQATEGKNHSNIEALSGDDRGLLLDMTGSSATVSYNGVVDLKKLGSRTPVISFTPNHSYGGSISKVVVTLTDVYDPSISMRVQFLKNSNTTATASSYDNTMVRAIYDGISVAVPNYYPLTTDAVGWDTSFHNFWRSESHTDPNKTYNPAEQSFSMNFAFDVENNIVYSYGLFHLVEWGDKTPPEGYPTEAKVGWYPIANLNSASLAIPFRGFTTGEVYVSLQVESGRGDVMLHSIGGVTAGVAASRYGTDSNLLLKGFDGSLPAAMGVPYQLPAAAGVDMTQLSCKVILGQQEIPVENNSFTPEKVDTYRVIYTGVNQFGREVSREISVKCIEKPELTVSYLRENVKYGDVYTVRTPELSGYGDISYTVKLNGEPVQPGQKVLVQDTMSITVSASDALQSKEQSYSLNVDKNVVTYAADFPRAALCGSSFTFPKAQVVDHLTGKTLDYEIYVNGTKQSEAMTLPENAGTVQVEYRTAKGSKVYSLQVRKAGDILSGGEALILPQNAATETNEAGTEVTVSRANPVVGLPYMLSANNLSFQFVVLQEQLNFNAMTVRLWDKNDTAITASIVGLKEDQPVLYINGTNTAVKVNKQAQTFNSGPYLDKLYYTYTITYDNYYGAMLNASRIQSYVDTDLRGLEFGGFQGGVYMDIYPEQLDSGAGEVCYIITQISNQYFYSSAFEYGDSVGPALSTTDFFIGNNYIRSGYVLRVKNLWVYDVLQPGAALTVTLMAPNGAAVFQNADPRELEDTTLDRIGVYQLKVVANDGNTGRNSTTYQFNVEDVTAPQLTVNGTVPQTSRAGQSITLPGATATDDSQVTLQLIIYTPNGEVITVSGEEGTLSGYSFTAWVSGVYRVRYIATDKRGNVETQSYSIQVEGSK